MTKETFFKEKDKLERDISELVSDFVKAIPKDIPVKDMDIEIINHRDPQRILICEVIITVSL